MNKRIIFIVSFSLVLLSCSREKDSIPDPPTTNPSTSPVETNPPNANYSPAFPGQTRVSGVTTSARYTATVVTTSLTNPGV